MIQSPQFLQHKDDILLHHIPNCDGNMFIAELQTHNSATALHFNGKKNKKAWLLHDMTIYRVDFFWKSITFLLGQIIPHNIFRSRSRSWWCTNENHNKWIFVEFKSTTPNHKDELLPKLWKCRHLISYQVILSTNLPISNSQ